MKTLLIRCNDKSNINTREVGSVVGNMGVWPPLGLLYLASSLKENNHNVEILDLLLFNFNKEELKEKIKTTNPDIIGITITTPEIQEALKIAKIAKELNKVVVVGGTHLSIFPKETLSFDYIDYGILGDGEITLLKLIEHIQDNKYPLNKIEGLIYKDKGIKINGVSIIKNLDELPFPDWSLVNLKDYSRADALFPLATIASARGCPYQCGFCFRSEEQKVVRIRSAKNIVDEIENLVNKYKIKEIIFSNDIITINRDQMIGICNEILMRNINISWQGATRVNLIDRELLTLMKKAGCKQLKYGVESGDPRILKIMKKQIQISQIIEAFRLTKEVGIKTGAYFIIGYVGENEFSMRRTIDFAKKLNPDYVMFYPGVPLPKTSFHELSVQAGLIDKNYWREYSLKLRKDKLPYVVKNVEKFINTAFREFYSRPGYIMKKLIDQQSWKALIKNPELLKGIFWTKIK